MAAFEVYGRITRRSLKNKTKADLASNLTAVINPLNMLALPKDDIIDIYLLVLDKIAKADRKFKNG